MSWKLFDKCTQDSGLVATGSPKIPNRIGYRLIAETDATCFFSTANYFSVVLLPKYLVRVDPVACLYCSQKSVFLTNASARSIFNHSFIQLCYIPPPQGHDSFHLSVHDRNGIYPRLCKLRMQTDHKHARHSCPVVLLQNVFVNIQLQTIFHTGGIWQVRERRQQRPIWVREFVRQILRALPIK